MFQTTSREAYQEVKPTVGQKQSYVLSALTAPMTNSEIADRLGWPINTVTPRTNELVKKGKVEMAYKRSCKITGRNAIAWRRVFPNTLGI